MFESNGNGGWIKVKKKHKKLQFVVSPEEKKEKGDKEIKRVKLK